MDQYKRGMIELTDLRRILNSDEVACQQGSAASTAGATAADTI